MDFASNILSSAHGGRRKLPYVLTEQGVSMLSSRSRIKSCAKNGVTDGVTHKYLIILT
jgi:hypothetical protein